MYSGSRGNEWESLQVELLGGQCRQLLDDIKVRHDWLQRFNTWSDIASNAHHMGPDEPGKDQLFRAIFGDARAQGLIGWHPVLLAVFWPDLL